MPSSPDIFHGLITVNFSLTFPGLEMFYDHGIAAFPGIVCHVKPSLRQKSCSLHRTALLSLSSASLWWRGSVPALLLVLPALLFLLFLQLVQSFFLLLCCTLNIFDAALQRAAIRRTEHAQTLQRTGGQLQLWSPNSSVL